MVDNPPGQPLPPLLGDRHAGNLELECSFGITASFSRNMTNQRRKAPVNLVEILDQSVLGPSLP
jgi:hypothetical protein